jgi:hypothetical protein
MEYSSAKETNIVLFLHVSCEWVSSIEVPRVWSEEGMESYCFLGTEMIKKKGSW